VRDDPVVTDLVTRARNGDKQAWDALVERYAPLIWSIGTLDARPRGSRPPWPTLRPYMSDAGQCVRCRGRRPCLDPSLRSGQAGPDLGSPANSRSAW
jgi:hypothetical protein